MKKILKIVSIVGILLTILISTSYATALAPEINEDALEVITTSLKKPTDLDDGAVNTDVFLMEDNAIVENNVNGNVYVVGEKINISSENIDGDIFIIGEEVTISSNVSGNVYGVANNLNISGNIRDAFVLVENLNIAESATCRDFKIIGENIKVDGNVDRDLYAATGIVSVSNTGKVGGILSTVNEIFENKENVNEIQKIEDIFLNFEQTDEQMEVYIDSFIKSLNIIFFIFAEMIGILIIALILLFTSKKQINNSELKEHGLKDTLYGLLYYIIAIAIIIGLICTIIGIPVAIILCFGLYLVLSKIAVPVASIQFTKTILKQENKSKILVWFVAFIIFTLAEATRFIPLCGIIKSIITLYGFGYMIRSLIRRKKEEETTLQENVI